MKKHIKIESYDLCVYYNPSDGEMREISEKISRLGASDTAKVKAFENLSHSNRGTTIANKRKKCILALISPQTSHSEYINTLSHETRHIVDTICEECGSENAAYLTGEIMGKLADWYS